MRQFYLLISLTLTVFVNAQIINFTDPNFKNKLLLASTTNMIALDASEASISVDSNSNNEIEVSEALNVKVLILDNSGITDLNGISNFTNLKRLICNNNLLTAITVDNSVTI